MKFLTRFHHSWNLEIWFSSRKWRKMMKWDFWYQGGTRKRIPKLEFQIWKSIHSYTCIHKIFAICRFLPKNGYFENIFCQKIAILRIVLPIFWGSFLMWIQIFMLVVTLGSPYWLGCPWQIYILNQCIPVGNRQIQFFYFWN